MAKLLAYIDEAGQRTSTTRSSDHFVMSAVVLREEDAPAAGALLARLRADLGRRPDDPLHWRNYRGHTLRLHASKLVGDASCLTVSSVVVCKRRLPPEQRMHSGDETYLHTFRLLLERLSWIARDGDRELSYCLSHVVHFPIGKLRHYEQTLREEPECTVAWVAVPGGGEIDQPNRVEELQLADIAASATFAAFEPDQLGYTESRYLLNLAPRLYRGRSNKLTSYGLKMHPWTEDARAAYPWVSNL